MTINKNKKQVVSKKKHSIKNPVVYKVTIDTDDDFMIDGESFFDKNITVSKDGCSAENLIKYLNNLHYEAHSSKQNKITDFKTMISKNDFKMGIKNLTTEESDFDHSTKIKCGTNHTIVITL